MRFLPTRVEAEIRLVGVVEPRGVDVRWRWVRYIRPTSPRSPRIGLVVQRNDQGTRTSSIEPVHQRRPRQSKDHRAKPEPYGRRAWLVATTFAWRSARMEVEAIRHQALTKRHGLWGEMKLYAWSRRELSYQSQIIGSGVITSRTAIRSGTAPLERSDGWLFGAGRLSRALSWRALRTGALDRPVRPR